MRKTNYLEAAGILSLSLLLTTSLSVSSCLPEMMREFTGYSRSSLELLISVPAFAMMAVIASTSILSRFIGERTMVIAGLLLFGTAGVVPVFTDVFEVIFLSRVLLGVGTGLLNTRAVSLIGERFTGSLRSRLQGIRCSMETLGQAALTLLAGQLLRFGWRYAFLIYGTAFIILVVYVSFVPARARAASSPKGGPSHDSRPSSSCRLTGRDWRFVLAYGLLGALVISTSVCISIRMASLVVESGIGTAVGGANILSMSVFSGFLGGLAFGKLMGRFKKFLLPGALALAAFGMVLISLADHLFLLGAGAVISGFCCTCCTSFIFNVLSDRLRAQVLDAANSAVLVGCNLGSFITPLILKAFSFISPELSFGYLAYGILLLLAAAGTLALLHKTSHQ